MEPDRLAALKIIAANFLAHRLSPLEAAWALSQFEYEAPDDLRAFLTAMVAVASETDAILLGERRTLWHPDVRTQEDHKHDEAQAWAEPMVREACERLVRDH
jgi:hypothetical protein